MEKMKVHRKHNKLTQTSTEPQNPLWDICLDQKTRPKNYGQKGHHSYPFTDNDNMEVWDETPSLVLQEGHLEWLEPIEHSEKQIS